MSDELDTLRRLADLRENATDGEWEDCWIGVAGETRHAVSAGEDPDSFIVCEGVETEGDEYIRDSINIRFIAAAGMPAERWRELVAYVERLERENEQYHQLCKLEIRLDPSESNPAESTNQA